MAHSSATLVGTTCLVLLAACSSSTKTGTGSELSASVPAPAAAATTTPSTPPRSATATTSVTATSAVPGLPATTSAPPASGTAVPTALDPCQLVTSSEASSLAGTSFGNGAEQTNGDEKECIYGGQTMNVFTVEVAQATDAATAQADWSQEEARAQAALKQKIPAGVNVALDTANVAGIGDRAATVQASFTISGQTIGVSGIYVLKGATFFAFQDLVLGKNAPSTADLQGQAQTVLGRVP